MASVKKGNIDVSLVARLVICSVIDLLEYLLGLTRFLLPLHLSLHQRVLFLLLFLFLVLALAGISYMLLFLAKTLRHLLMILLAH